MPRRLILAALAFFAVASVLGAAFAILGPVPFFRGLGLAALACGAAGCAVQLYALREFAPASYAELRERFADSVPEGWFAAARAS